MSTFYFDQILFRQRTIGKTALHVNYIIATNYHAPRDTNPASRITIFGSPIVKSNDTISKLFTVLPIEDLWY
jgi:hypothetical protein